MNAIVTIPSSGVEQYRQSTDAAGLCRDIVLKTAMEIQGRKYVKVEGWQALAVAHGCTASSRDVEAVEGGVRAIGEVRRMSDGAVIAEAEGFVGQDEPTWFGGTSTDRWGKTKTLPKRPDYAIRAMAQTRAISRACRSAFAHVVVLIDANLSTTPAEEVPLGGFDDDAPRNITPQADAPKAAPEPQSSAAKLVGWSQLDDEMDRCKTVAALEAWEKMRLADIGALTNGKKAALGEKFNALLVSLPKTAPASDDFAAAEIEEFA